jgi:hypothetical protein
MTDKIEAVYETALGPRTTEWPAAKPALDRPVQHT